MKKGGAKTSASKPQNAATVLMERQLVLLPDVNAPSESQQLCGDHALRNDWLGSQLCDSMWQE